MALRNFLSVWPILLCLACQSSNSQEGNSLVDTIPSKIEEPRITEVSILQLQPQSFAKETISQGKIEARNRSDVTFELSGRIESVMVETGKRVSKGQILARLVDFEQKYELKKLEHQIQQAQLELEAKLISLGYTTSDSTIIPSAIMKTARLESNLDGLELDRSLARYHLNKTEIKAPIAGVVGEVTAQSGNPTSAYEKLCTIIDDQRLEAVFPVLEQELSLLRVGQKVKIRPLHRTDKSYDARISAVMPQVDEHGMVKVFAGISSAGSGLLDGMHITAIVQDQLQEQLIVPKSAVLDRQGRQVVFIYRNGQAHWQYVEIGLENAETYTITEGLTAGDEVIIDNNFSLSHLEKVVIAKADN